MYFLNFDVIHMYLARISPFKKLFVCTVLITLHTLPIEKITMKKARV